jgi:hypothetical protein
MGLKTGCGALVFCCNLPPALSWAQAWAVGLLNARRGEKLLLAGWCFLFCELSKNYKLPGAEVLL